MNYEVVFRRIASMAGSWWAVTGGDDSGLPRAFLVAAVGEEYVQVDSGAASMAVPRHRIASMIVAGRLVPVPSGAEEGGDADVA